MANGNGNGNGMIVKVLLALSLLALGTIGTLVTIGAANVQDSMKAMEGRQIHVDLQVDDIEKRQIAYDKQQARVAISLYEIAKGLDIPSAIDTTAANEILRDST